MSAFDSTGALQDIYLLRYDGPVTDLKFDPSEVEDVKLVPMEQLKDVFAAQVRFMAASPSICFSRVVVSSQRKARSVSGFFNQVRRIVAVCSVSTLHFNARSLCPTDALDVSSCYYAWERYVFCVC